MSNESAQDEVQRRLGEDDTFRERVCDWLRSNGIDPVNVPAYERATYADGNLTLRMFLLDPRGKKQPEPEGTNMLVHTVTVPVEVPPSGDVAAWLAPRCSTCGR